MPAVDIDDRRGQQPDNHQKRLIAPRLIGLRGRLELPFWGLLGAWSAVCGALASNQLAWDGEAMLTLAVALLLVDLAWGSLWDLAVGTDWAGLLNRGWPPKQMATIPSLPFTQPSSPAGRLSRWANRVAGWWRETLWPQAGGASLGLLAAGALALVLSLLLPDRLYPLSLALVAVIGVGIIQRRRGSTPAAAQAFVLVGLGWIAGHAVFAPISKPSLVLALCFFVATWGALRMAGGLRGGLWLLDGAQGAAVALLIWLEQPLPAALVGICLFGQIALQPALRLGADPARVAPRIWPWLMVSMLVAALAIP